MTNTHQFRHAKLSNDCFRDLNLFTNTVLNRYGGITVGNIQNSIPASFGRKIPPIVRKIAVRRSAQVRKAFWNVHKVHKYLLTISTYKQPLTHWVLMSRFCTTTKVTTACQRTSTSSTMPSYVPTCRHLRAILPRMVITWLQLNT